MKTEVSDEFVKTRGDAKGKPEWSRSGQPQSQAQPMAEQKISNWRDRASAPTTNPQPAAESWRQNSSRQQGGSSSVPPAQAPRTAAPAATVTPQDQTLALMSLLGLKKEREATQSLESTQQQPQPRPPPLQQAPTPGQMPVSPFSRLALPTRSCAPISELAQATTLLAAGGAEATAERSHQEPAVVQKRPGGS